jgi:hypothetical protein
MLTTLCQQQPTSSYCATVCDQRLLANVLPELALILNSPGVAAAVYSAAEGL